MRMLALCLLGFALVAAPAQADKDDAFLTGKKAFKRDFKVIALAPVDFDVVLEAPPSIAPLIEEEVTRHLEKRGYRVLPSSVLEEIRTTLTEQVGGYTDPETGRIDVDKFRAVREHAVRELWFRHDLDALATLRVMASQAEIESDRVEWHGTRQKIEVKGRRANYKGKVFVSSVTVAVFDETNRLVYVYDGGLEPIMRREGEQLVPVPAAERFSDEKRIRKAAQIAVSPI